MNVAIISYHTCPLATLGGKDTGGMNVYVRDLCIYLGKIGIHADVFTRSQDKHVPHILHELGFGNKVVHIPAGPETPIPKQALIRYLPEFINNIEKFAITKNVEYDVIHTHYWLSGLCGLKLKRKWKKPMVHMYHTLAKLKNEVAQNDGELEGQYRIDGETEVGKSTDRIIAATAKEKDQISNLYEVNAKKIEIIPPGVDTTHFYPIPADEAKDFIGVPPDEKMFLFVGRIEPLKGIDNLIRALAAIQKSDILSQCPHYLIVIGGNPDEKNNDLNKEMKLLKNLSENLGLRDLVLFIGKRAQEFLPYYYSAAETVVMPSHYESFGMVALEAMACGTPVVATQVGGLDFLVKNGKTGLTVPDGDLEALEKSLTLLICKPDFREELSKNCVNYASTFSWKNIIPRIEKIYESLLNDTILSKNAVSNHYSPD